MNIDDLKINTPLCLSISFLLGLLVGYVDFNAPEVQPAVLLLLVVTIVMGFLNPDCAWRVAIITGIGIPAVHYFAFVKGIKPHYEMHGQYAVALLPQIPSFIGAYSGVFLRKLASNF